MTTVTLTASTGFLPSASAITSVGEGIPWTNPGAVQSLVDPQVSYAAVTLLSGEHSQDLAFPLSQFDIPDDGLVTNVKLRFYSRILNTNATDWSNFTVSAAVSTGIGTHRAHTGIWQNSSADWHSFSSVNVILEVPVLWATLQDQYVALWATAAALGSEFNVDALQAEVIYQVETETNDVVTQFPSVEEEAGTPEYGEWFSIYVPERHEIWRDRWTGNTILRYHATTGALLTPSITVPYAPGYGPFYRDPTNGEIYATIRSSGPTTYHFSVINPNTLTIDRTISLGTQDAYVAGFSPDGTLFIRGWNGTAAFFTVNKNTGALTTAFTDDGEYEPPLLFTPGKLWVMSSGDGAANWGEEVKLRRYDIGTLGGGAKEPDFTLTLPGMAYMWVYDEPNNCIWFCYDEEGYHDGWQLTQLKKLDLTTLTVTQTIDDVPITLDSGEFSPMRLTDGVLWVVSESTEDPAYVDRYSRLTGVRTSDGEVIKQLYFSDFLPNNQAGCESGTIPYVNGNTVWVADAGCGYLYKVQVSYPTEPEEPNPLPCCVLKFVKRSADLVPIEIADADLDAYDATGEPSFMETSRTMDNELPSTLSVGYMNRAMDYEVNTRQAKRILDSTQDSSGEAQLTFSMVFTDTKAQEIAEVNLFTAWQNRISYSLKLPKKYCYLEPTDVIRVRGHTARIITIKESPSGILELTLLDEALGNYAPHVVVTESLPIIQTPQQVSGTTLALLDIPLIKDEDEGVVIYLAVARSEADKVWTGASIQRSTNGLNFTEIAAVMTESTLGTATSVLGDYTGNTFDELNSVSITLEYGALTSSSEEAVLGGANLAYLGGELIQFKTATLEEDGSYTLTGLLRGRRGTEHRIATHVPDERFVLLDSVLRVTTPTSDIEVIRTYRAVSTGQVPATARVLPLFFKAKSVRPYTPVQLGGGRNSSGDVVISWTRRTRLSGEWRSNVDVPIGETTEAYEVDIFSDDTFSTVKRTLSTSTPTVTYTAADQVTDFGSPQPEIFVNIHQLSSIVGRGLALTGSV